ncbi:MAG: MiaB/RimO family radical SAM methylthiotransferase [Treponema sp.]
MTKNKSAKKYFLDQHGCAKNQVDGELIITRLENLGMERTLDADEADLIIINSCGFIESAKKESLDSVLNSRKAYPKVKILLAGCLAERYANVFKTDLPEVNGIFGNGDLSKLDEVVGSILKGKRPVVVPEQKGVCCGERGTLLSFKGSAYVKITEGCNNHCTFCAIPLIRGDLRSRKALDIVEEIKGLVQKGVYEINLIGQDLAAYGCGKDDDVFNDGTCWYEQTYGESRLSRYSVALNGNAHVIPTEVKESRKHNSISPLSRLIKMISKLKGKFVVRLLYIHPDHFNLDILPLMQKDKRFLPYFDIPFQSGSDNVIHAMNRTGSHKGYVELVKKIRDALPEASIRTTFLTGFPGETEDDAKKTEKFLKEIQSDWSGCFPYSKEDGTPAAKMKGKVAKKIAEERAQNLQSIQHDITGKRLKARLGKTYDVLVEEIIENKEQSDEGLAIGRAWFEAPEVDGNVVIRYDLDDKKAVEKIKCGNVVKVKAVASTEFDIDGEYVAK